jgi:hypothetical protein
VTRERALDRLRKLLALAAAGSGASVEEARSAALAATRLMAEHGLAPGSPSDSPASVIDLDAVASLSFKVIELERLLDERRRAHAQELRDHDRRWAQVVEDVRREERAAQRKAAKTLTKTAAVQEREALARSGGRARAQKLDPERRREIGRAAVAARWKKWRERNGVEQG